MSIKQKALTAFGLAFLCAIPSSMHATETQPTSRLTHANKEFVADDPILFQTIISASTGDIEPQTIPQKIEVVPTTGDRIVDVALSQLGVTQDCTDLVQNSLAALGLTQRRDSSGIDFGTDIGNYFGYEVPWSEALPGDLVWRPPSNGGHVFVLLDPTTGEGVHGGWSGLNTAIGIDSLPIDQQTVIRLY